MQKQSLTSLWQFRQLGSIEWLPAQVPGGVHTDLMALARIPDPFVGDNEKRVAWVAESDWEYHTTFNVQADVFQRKNIWLVCDGLDTLALLTLNGKALGETNNMFRQYRFDIKSLLKAEGNELTITFKSPVKFVTEKNAARPMNGVSQAIAGGPHLRKAPCHFGWDWGPQLPPIGIWKDIYLEAYDSARISEVHLRQKHDNGKVTISARVEVENGNAPLSATLLVTAPDGSEQAESVSFTSASGVVSVQVKNPQLWWPNGLGDQPLYQVRVLLSEGNQTLDEKKYQMGLRKIELKQEPDEWGKSFTFVVNGHPFFAKGADWIPADSFPTRLTEEALEGLIRSAVATHQNMLRVWGGGFYEDERFYDLCDRYGILLWQDFIFSCSIYPLDEPEFLENVRVEVVENIRRIRHRASLALWCGNNEMEQGWAEWGWQNPELDTLKAVYDKFFHHTLKDWCNAEDPDNVYWPSSPSSDVPFEDPNGQIQGDAHYWEVWHRGKPFTAYRDQYPRFMSEFGFQALPPLETIRTFAEESEWNMTSYIMERHQKNDSGNSLIVRQMLDTFRLPKDFDALVYLSLVLQAEGIRYGVEHWRRHTNRVSGTLYWQLNDCWPVASWASLDYFGRWKALHYAARRFYAPLMLSIEDAPPKQSIFISSDLMKDWSGKVRWSLVDLDGKVLTSGEKAASVSVNGVTAVESLDFSQYLNDDLRRELAFIAELWEGDTCLARQSAFFAPTKHLKLKAPQITSTLSAKDGVLSIEVSSKSFARLVEVSLSGADVVFSDNYFDLPANTKVTVTAPLPAGWDLKKAKAAFKVRSVFDTYSN
ncbi:MAG TPA: glycoside hydrolase family 2 protein [Anaerolineales bacterium]|nr:glycoside hydrolase family 2 protein [Anaerolineales bacterium]